MSASEATDVRRMTDVSGIISGPGLRTLHLAATPWPATHSYEGSACGTAMHAWATRDRSAVGCSPPRPPSCSWFSASRTWMMEHLRWLAFTTRAPDL